jgi:hypothetical protein
MEMSRRTPLWMWMEDSEMATAETAPERAKIRDLQPGTRVRMYHTIVQILGAWFVPEGELKPGWGRLPMKWDGLECAPPEKGDTEVEVVPDDARPGRTTAEGQ